MNQKHEEYYQAIRYSHEHAASVITFFYPEIPPPVNKIYYNRPGAGRGLTARAREYKNRYRDALLQHILHCENYDPSLIENHRPYYINLVFFMSGLMTAGWPKKAKNRFKKLDVDNLVKLLVDSISEAIGVDDRCNLSVSSTKVPVPQHASVEEGVFLDIRRLPDD
jgi:Holliday junction resolvase RusA-like endonuclease